MACAERFNPADLPRVVVICGHYGVGKTNLTLNLARDAQAAGRRVVVIDSDVVNPYFRSSDYAHLLEDEGVSLVAPVFAGSTLDSPSISGQVQTVLAWAARQDESQADPLVLIDAGGDDVGVTSLARFREQLRVCDAHVVQVINHARNLTTVPQEACEVMCEIEAKLGIASSALINNTHLREETDVDTICAGIAFAAEVQSLANLDIWCSCVPRKLEHEQRIVDALSLAGSPEYAVDRLVSFVWE